jgi:hypothetical protein
LRGRVSGAVGLLALTPGFLAILLLVKTSVQILTSVTVFAKTIIKEIMTKFGFVLHVKKCFVSDFIFIMGKGALK